LEDGTKQRGVDLYISEKLAKILYANGDEEYIETIDLNKPPPKEVWDECGWLTADKDGGATINYYTSKLF